LVISLKGSFLIFVFQTPYTLALTAKACTAMSVWVFRSNEARLHEQIEPPWRSSKTTVTDHKATL